MSFHGNKNHLIGVAKDVAAIRSLMSCRFQTGAHRFNATFHRFDLVATESLTVIRQTRPQFVAAPHLSAALHQTVQDVAQTDVHQPFSRLFRF